MVPWTSIGSVAAPWCPDVGDLPELIARSRPAQPMRRHVTTHACSSKAVGRVSGHHAMNLELIQALGVREVADLRVYTGWILER